MMRYCTPVLPPYLDLPELHRHFWPFENCFLAVNRLVTMRLKESKASLLRRLEQGCVHKARIHVAYLYAEGHSSARRALLHPSIACLDAL